MLPTALEGVRVLDLTHHIAGPFCTKLLADHGADVIKIERPPGGDPARRLGPFFHDEPHLEGSALFLHLNTNKRSVTLNLKSSEGQAIARRLAADAQIVVENFRPGVLDRLNLGYAALHVLNPALTLVSISNFGQTGPYRDLKASEITEYAMGGAMNQTGHASREPLKLGGYVAQYHAGSTAAYATMLSLLRAEDEGEGDYVDISIYETQAGSRDRRTVTLTGYAYTGRTSQRVQPAVRLASGVRPTADGYVDIAGYGARLPGFLRMIEREDFLSDPRFSIGGAQANSELVEEIETAYLMWLMQRGKAEALAAAQAQHLISGAINTIADLFSDAHFVERAPWDVVDHPHTGPVTYPGRPFVMSATPRRSAARAPLLGEHTAAVLCAELGYPHDDLPRLAAQRVI